MRLCWLDEFVDDGDILRELNLGKWWERNKPIIIKSIKKEYGEKYVINHYLKHISVFGQQFLWDNKAPAFSEG